jgi:tRNA threonylcarbamoyladenosine biosynthesis protein TsaB
MLLAVDTSTRIVGVALYDGISVLSEVAWISKNHHTIELGPAVSDSLSRVGAEPTDLSAVGVAMGPGSFTGLRIGLAFSKGLALSCRIPILGIQTLDALVAAHPVTDTWLAAVLEAGRNRLAVGLYQNDGENWQMSGELQNLTYPSLIEQLPRPVKICGELRESLRDLLNELGDDVYVTSPAHSIRRPAFIAELAWSRWQKGDVDDPALLKPIYLHYGDPIPG